MRKTFHASLILVTIMLAQTCASGPNLRSVPSFKVTSSVFKNNARLNLDQVGNTFGCTGKNISPDLQWTGAPPETVAYAITLYDPDAPTGSGFWHWIVLNVPPTVTSLDLDAGKGNASMPAGSTTLKNDGGAAIFRGACPPIGDPEHRYILTVYALKEKLPVDSIPSAAVAGFMINRLKIAEGTITARYSR